MGTDLVVAASTLHWTLWGSPSIWNRTQRNAFHGVRLVREWLFSNKLFSRHMDSHTPSSEDLSKFLEGQTSVLLEAKSSSWLKRVPVAHSNIFMQHWCSCWCVTLPLDIGSWLMALYTPAEPVLLLFSENSFGHRIMIIIIWPRTDQLSQLCCFYREHLRTQDYDIYIYIYIYIYSYANESSCFLNVLQDLVNNSWLSSFASSKKSQIATSNHWV